MQKVFEENPGTAAGEGEWKQLVEKFVIRHLSASLLVLAHITVLQLKS